MRDNPIQFAVVREDPRIEEEVIRRSGARRALMIGSGGCTALTLQSVFPEMEFTLLDPNPAQTDLIREKTEALSATQRRDERFNIGSDDPSGLNACGNFESLFRGLRRFLWDFVAPEEEWAGAFECGDREFFEGRIFPSRYWPVAFDLYFSDSLLNTMFGPDATQHARKNSYPGYFREKLARGLVGPGISENYFIHHIFLGRYVNRAECLPRYLTHPPQAVHYQYVNGFLEDVELLEDYDMIHLSNIFDWMDRETIERITRLLTERMRPEAWFTLRQLNNKTEYKALFGGSFSFDANLESRLLREDRSLFYEKLTLGRKT